MAASGAEPPPYDAAGEPAAADHELITRVRAGDTRAYGELFRRHRGAALAYARRFASTEASADDLVDEAFTRTLEALLHGNGPQEAFRPYLFVVVRRAAFDWSSDARRERLADDVEAVPGVHLDAAADPAAALLERAVVAWAFHSLSERHRTVLWHTVVQEEPPATVGRLLGIAPEAVGALAYRAREQLRRAYLQAHLGETVAPACHPVASMFGTYVRGGLSRRNRERVEAHLAACPTCPALVARLRGFNEHIRGLVGPLVCGGGAFALLGTQATGMPAVTGAAKGVGALVTWLHRLRPSRAREWAAAGAATAAVALAALALALGGGPPGRHPLPPPSAARRPAPPPAVRPPAAPPAAVPPAARAAPPASASRRARPPIPVAAVPPPASPAVAAPVPYPQVTAVVRPGTACADLGDAPPTLGGDPETAREVIRAYTDQVVDAARSCRPEGRPGVGRRRADAPESGPSGTTAGNRGRLGNLAATPGVGVVPGSPDPASGVGRGPGGVGPVPAHGPDAVAQVIPRLARHGVVPAAALTAPTAP